MSEDHGDSPVSLLLRKVESGDHEARNELLTIVYERLRSLAHRTLKDLPSRSVAPTALVHEAYLRLFASPTPSFRGHRHFFAKAARAMRTILIDAARGRSRGKRRRDGKRVLLDEIVDDYEQRHLDLLSIDEALESLGKMDPLVERIAELRIFVRHTLPEIAEIVDLSLRQVQREWAVAKAFLHRALGREPKKDAPNAPDNGRSANSSDSPDQDGAPS